MNPTTRESIRLMREALKTPLPPDVAKAFTQPATSTTGLNYYNLEAPSKKLFPFLTMLRNIIPRVSSPGGTAVQWKAITGINTDKTPAGVSEGHRNAAIAHTLAEKVAPFRGLGLEDYVTAEAGYAGGAYEDVVALAVEKLLQAFMMEEEQVILWGNGSDGIALGTTPTPTATVSAGGNVTDGTYKLICIALTYPAYLRSVVGANGVPGQLSRTNMDGSSDTVNLGSATQSAASANITTSGGNNTVNGVVAAVRGAVAYAWYLGTAGAEKIVAITTANKVTIADLPAGGNQAASAAPAADRSKDALVYTGMFSQIVASGSGAYYKTMGNTGLVADTKGGCATLETALAYLWDTYKLGITDLYMSARDAHNLTTIVLTGGSSVGAFTFQPPAEGSQGGLVGGMILDSYLSRYTPAPNKRIKINVHPYAVPGTIIGVSNSNPYPMSGVTNPWELEMRREYYAIEWPMVTRQREFGVYCDGALKGYAPFAALVLTDVADAVA